MPLYRQVEADLRARILSGRLAPSTRLPSEGELAVLYGASKITVRQALARLATEGLVSRQPGKGTFVRSATLTAGSRMVSSYTEEMASLHLTAGSRVLRQELGKADETTAQRLGVELGTPVLVLDRLRLGNGTPVGVQRARILATFVPGLEELDLTDATLYGVLRERYGLVPSEAEEVFRVGAISSADAHLLEVPPRTCCFLVERVTLIDTKPFEFVRSVMRGDRYQVRLGLKSNP
jgi:GntR family transcriptional regulator, N-acetylglucosamine utilization regulator